METTKLGASVVMVSNAGGNADALQVNGNPRDPWVDLGTPKIVVMIACCELRCACDIVSFNCEFAEI
jgi:hypothetical protein